VSDTVLSVWDGVDLNYHNLINIFLHHLEVPASFIPGSLLLGGAAWWWAPRQGWDRKFAVLAGCALALALALTVVRPFGQFPAGGLSPLATLHVCTVGSGLSPPAGNCPNGRTTVSDSASARAHPARTANFRFHPCRGDHHQAAPPSSNDPGMKLAGTSR